MSTHNISFYGEIRKKYLDTLSYLDIALSNSHDLNNSHFFLNSWNAVLKYNFSTTAKSSLLQPVSHYPKGTCCRVVTLYRNYPKYWDIFFLFFWFWLYGPLKNISLISSRLFIKGGWKPKNPGKNDLTIRKQNLTFPHVTWARLEPQWWET